MVFAKRIIVVVIICAVAAVALAVGLSSLAKAPSSAAPSSSAAASGATPVLAAGHGWTDSGVQGPMPAEGACHLRWTASHEPLPDPACTPGAIDSAVAQGNLGQTVCRKGGYTSSVRPPVGITNKAKTQIMAAYGIPASDASKYELDHLIPLADGGASDIRNLWPEPNVFASAQHSNSAFVHNDKDQVEQDAFAALCSGSVSLDSVQKTMAGDWTSGRYASASGGDDGAN
ncbi:HNH endonuclease signature motif containing protein [Sinomonas sp. JGH33]|uniref:HNH endonuclease signature motif containing protein n=1 Tax=Sinomonas terricola TaxID=3110330 RepID=A0ABU5T8R1_9MICC|nr:HNH endonuclease signature motif containing protein [Sinomonas sp. JGH33]MEA5455915.1 HNH endonuclease signature motif containing protein [Sinomonas sp. JGH33]